MAQKVLKELEELRSMLAQPTPTLTGSPGAARMPSFSHLSAPLLLSTPPYSTSSFHTPLSASPGASYVGHGAFTGAAAGPFPATATAQYGSPSKPGSSRMAERLGRALEAAQEEMDAARARQADIINSQLRSREVDLSEAQRVAAAAQAEASILRSQLAAAKQAAAADAAAAEARLASKDAELSATQAELLAVRAEADDLQQRLADGNAALGRADAALSAHTNDLSRRLQKAAADAEAAAAAAAWEREQKESVLAQLSVCQADLAAAREQLAAAAEELQHTHRQAALEAESRHQLESALKGTAAAASTLKEAKDLEISELRQRLRAERNVRKACQAWLQGELKSREEMEGLLQAVRDVTAAPLASQPQAAAPAPAAGPAAAPAVASAVSPGSSGSGKHAAAAEAARTAVNVAMVESLLAHLSDEPQQQQQQQQRWCAAEPQQQQQQQQEAHKRAAGGISRLLEGEAQANKACKEFVQMKAALGKDSRRLRAELDAAKELLRSRMQRSA